ncbi:MAG: hypothetical protein J6K39_00415 [Clostridia bacterium]|nr:hypothetical protein [Clostridia bacterium]
MNELKNIYVIEDHEGMVMYVTPKKNRDIKNAVIPEAMNEFRSHPNFYKMVMLDLDKVNVEVDRDMTLTTVSYIWASKVAQRKKEESYTK